MLNQNLKFKKIVLLDSIILYPEHRKILNKMADEIVEYPSSLPENLEKQYEDHPEIFKNKRCYTQIGADNIPSQLLMNRIDGADVVISCWTDIPDEILKLNPQLKIVVFWTHEKEHRINIELADKLGISVANIPDYGTDSVTEVVFAGLLELLQRSHLKQGVSATEQEIAPAVLNALFSKYRKLASNEKNTRLGKFTHHFHKLGMVDYTFEKNSIEDLIPEQLLEGKTIALINVELKNLWTMLNSFGTYVTEFEVNDDNLAEFYKICATNDTIIYDSLNLKNSQAQKMKQLFSDKLIDIRKLVGINYRFENKIFGVVGLGRIGAKVARLAKNLGFSVVYYSKTRKNEIEDALNIKCVDLKELAKISDVISIHVPAHKAENLVSAEIINEFKKGAIFINTADGNAVDQYALTNRLNKDEITAFLDVYPGLPRKDILGLPMADKMDWKLKDTLNKNVFTYRAGWKTQESIRVKTYKMLGLLSNHLIKTNYGEVAEWRQAQTGKV